MPLRERCDEFSVRLHVKGLAERNETTQKRLHEHHQQQAKEVDGGHAEEEKSFSSLAVVKLSESWDYGEDDRHVGVTLVILSC